MKSRIIPLALFTLFAVGVTPTPMRTGSAGPLANGPSQNSDTSRRQKRVPPEGDACATAPVEEAERQKVEEALQKHQQERQRVIEQDGVQALSLTTSVTIQVWFHVIRKGTSVADGNVAEATLDEQINVLNRSYGGQTGGASTNFRFVKAGVTRTTNPTWFQMTYSETAGAAERQAKTALHRGGPDVLNFYTIGPFPSAWATFPWEYTNDPIRDGVVCPFPLLPNGGSVPFGAGDIGVHEVGHWLGLYHTHQGGCTGTDGVADTPAHREQQLNDGVVGACPADGLYDTCPGDPGPDPIHNFMQSSSDACKYEFTPGQAARMDSMHGQYRQPVVTPTASVAWVRPSEFTWGPPNTMTVSGHARDGFGGVQMVWRDATSGGGENVVAWQPTPNPTDHTWTNTIDSPNRCHDYSVYVNYAGIRSPTFVYRGRTSGYCTETTRVIWIQPYSTAGIGSPGSLIVAGSAENAPPGYGVRMWYRDATAGTGWVLHPYAPYPDSNGIWLNEIPNANYSHVYQVQVTYDVVTSAVCSYAGQNSISWCQ
jgi:hypothetical protein